MKIVFLDASTLDDVDFSNLKNRYDLELYNLTDKSEIQARIANADVVITNKVVLSKTELESAKNLKLICVAATGFNNIDTNACKELGIAVTNVKNYSTPAVIQHTFALAFALNNKIAEFDSFVKNGDYEKSPHFSSFDYSWEDICGKNWGIIGLGTIGVGVAKVAQLFGANVSYFSVSGTNKNTEFKSVSLEELLSSCDIISIHSPLSDLTKNLINEKNIKLLKKDAIIINVARGGIVNENAIINALKQKDIAGFATDVFEVEPILPDSPFLTYKENNLVLTPHIAWASKQSREKLLGQISSNIEAFFNGETLNRVV